MTVWKIVIVSGSGNWKDRGVIYEVLSETQDEIEADGCRMLLRHGGAKGADTMADEWANETNRKYPFSVKVEEYPANWHNCGVSCGGKFNVHKKKNKLNQLYCPTAGIRRNARMIRDGAWRCLVFILDCSPGATNCYNLAKKADIDVRPYRQGRLPADSSDVDNRRSRR